MQKIILVLPAYNAEATLQKTILDMPLGDIDEIVLVDDASKDNTVERAREIVSSHPRLALFSEHETENKRKIPFTIIQHEKNKGYGGNQKNCYHVALEHNADIVVMLHPDYQYDPKCVKDLVRGIKDGSFDVMLGSRIRSRKEALAGGMPAYKYYGNRFLSFIENTATHKSLSEWHTGMRAYTKAVLENIPYDTFSDDFIFDTQALFGIIEKGYSIGEIPVPVRYFEEASSINFSRSARYGTLTLFETCKFVFKKQKQFFKYIAAGGFAALINLGFYTLLVYGFHMWYLTAAFIAFLCGALVSFTLQKLWVFRRRSFQKMQYELAVYATLVAFNIFANDYMLFIFVQKLMLGKLIANIISNCIVAAWSFFIYKNVAFKNRNKISQ